MKQRSSQHERAEAHLEYRAAAERAKRIVDEFRHEIAMSVEQSGRLQGAIRHELERYKRTTNAGERMKVRASRKLIVLLLIGAPVIIVLAIIAADFFNQPTEDQLYGCSVAMAAPNGECQ